MKETTINPGIVLIMRCDKGWYPINAVDGVSLEQQARDHGEINPHIHRIELVSGEVLWSREKPVIVH